MENTKKRVALVTGATGGLGTAMCKELHKDGFTVIANYRNQEKADVWQAKMKEDGFDIKMAAGDVCNFESVGEMVKQIEAEHCSIDVLVNNAGITRDGRFSKMKPEDWHAVIDTNLNSVFNCTRNVIEAMIERNFGRIINISSVGGMMAMPTMFSTLNGSTAGQNNAMNRSRGSRANSQWTV